MRNFLKVILCLFALNSFFYYKAFANPATPIIGLGSDNGHTDFNNGPATSQTLRVVLASPVSGITVSIDASTTAYISETATNTASSAAFNSAIYDNIVTDTNPSLHQIITNTGNTASSTSQTAINTNNIYTVEQSNNTYLAAIESHTSLILNNTSTYLPLIGSRSWFLNALTDSVTVSGGPTVAQQISQTALLTQIASNTANIFIGPLNVSGTGIRLWTLNSTTDSVSVSGVSTMIADLLLINQSVVSNTASTSAAIGVMNGNIISGFSTNHLDSLNINSSVVSNTVATTSGNAILTSISFSTSAAATTAHADAQNIITSIVSNTAVTSTTAFAIELNQGLQITQETLTASNTLGIYNRLASPLSVLLTNPTVTVSNTVQVSGIVSTKKPMVIVNSLAVSFGSSSTSLVSSNSLRAGMSIQNTSINGCIESFNFGSAAVSGAGIVLYPINGSFNMDEYDFYTSSLNGTGNLASGCTAAIKESQ